MEDAGYQFEVIVPDDSAEDCGICTTGGPAHLVMDLALRKAADVARGLANNNTEPTLIIACDIVAECDGTVLGKPANEDHARNMLERLRGKQHRVYSGLCLWRLGNKIPLPFREGLREGLESPLAVPPQTHLAITELRMDPISDADLEAYLASGL